MKCECVPAASVICNGRVIHRSVTLRFILHDLLDTNAVWVDARQMMTTRTLDVRAARAGKGRGARRGGEGGRGQGRIRRADAEEMQERGASKGVAVVCDCLGLPDSCGLTKFHHRGGRLCARGFLLDDSFVGR